MKAMILAAGRGERMRPKADATPKPLLTAGGKALVVHLIERLTANGLVDLVINHAWLGEQIEAALGDGSAFGARIAYSPETLGELETGGGIRQALPLLGDEPFLAVSADIWTDFPFASVARAPQGPAHLVMVDNPPYHPHGDFALDDRRVRSSGPSLLTFGNIGVYRPELFARHPPGRFGLGGLLRETMEHEHVSGEHYRGEWYNVGTPEDLAALDRRLTR